LILSTGNRVIHFESIDSTNLEAARRAAAGEKGPLWLWADRQTGGKGRLGRTWISEPGNLYATILFSSSAPPENASQLSFVAALAVHDVVQALLPGKAVKIKWPNDLLIEGAKVCGILAEVLRTNPLTVAVGCGLNIAHAPKDTPYPATALAHHGAAPPLDVALREIDATLANRLNVWNDGQGFEKIRSAWKKVAIGMGFPAEARIGSETLNGIVRGLAPDGALIFELRDSTQKLIHAGEVRFSEFEAKRKTSS
jgi:BirA family biotin operon repressor/biotin-[acetyl-CoA-carboxylase] ligase